jgi:hypothetical protein
MNSRGRLCADWNKVENLPVFVIYISVPFSCQGLREEEVSITIVINFMEGFASSVRQRECCNDGE